MSTPAAPSRFRRIEGTPRYISDTLLCLIALASAVWALELPSRLGFAFFLEQYLGLILGLSLAATFLIVRSGFGGDDRRVPWHDWMLAAGGLTVGLYVTILFPRMAYTLSALSPDRWLLGGLAILLVLEATRRLVGFTLIILAVVLLAYAKWAYLMPGLLYGRGASFERIATYVFLDANGIFGIALVVSATIVAAYILFGQVLHSLGGETVFTDVALALLGRYRGGPAKVAVLSSSLFGTMSGSVVSNVVVGGNISIPMMKRNGYSAEFASATEASASTGGQIMPPVMGVAAFIIAENLSIPYAEVALAAVVPAVLYYVSLFLQVDLEARKAGVRALSPGEVPSLGRVLRTGWLYFLPLAVLIYTLLIAFWSAPRAGMAAAGTTLLVGAFLRPPGFGWRMMVDILRQTGRTLLDIVIISALAGIVIGALQLSGLGFTLSLVLTSLASHSMILLLLVTAVVCTILGMGMPTTVIYVMLAVMVAPALVQTGIEPLAAHLFIFYFGMLSMVTPPVCMAVIAAVAIGHAEFWRTALIAVRLSIVAYLVPFFFVFHPGLLLQEVGPTLVLDLTAAVIGVGLLASGSAGYLFGRLGWPVRAALAVAGCALIAPATSGLLQAVNVAGLLVGGGLVGWLWWRGRDQAAPRPAE